MSTEMVEIGAVPAAWTRRHLLDLESLSAEEINIILDAARMFKEATDDCRQKLALLAGTTCANLFFENSTRTRTSFALAARRLGADAVDFSSSGSSLSKGPPRRSRRWASTWWRSAIPRPALPGCWPRTSTAR
jgi:aspartate carbamoyltransferase catalytic subunit